MPTPRKHADNAARHRAYRQRRQQTWREALAAKGMPAAPPLATLPSKARWQALQQQALANLKVLREEMQDYQDERSAKWQEGDRGQALLEAGEALDDILVELEGWELP